MRCNARRNPFRASQIESIPFRFLSESKEDVLLRFRELNRRGAIVGPHGTGKTTLLEELKCQFRSQSMKPVLVRLNEERKILSESDCIKIDQSKIVLLDGAEQLSRFRWKRLLNKLRPEQGLIITTHEEGRLPTLYTCSSDERLFQELAGQLAPELPMQPSMLNVLYQKHSGNMRDAFFELYDKFGVY